jgi:CRP-like cAMP-binding protein
VRHSILAALLASQYERLLPKLEHVTLKGGEIVYRADQKIEHVYFPEEAVVAMIDSMDDGRTVEVGIIGREGLVGINIFLGGIVTPDKACNSPAAP